MKIPAKSTEVDKRTIHGWSVSCVGAILGAIMALCGSPCLAQGVLPPQQLKQEALAKLESAKTGDETFDEAIGGTIASVKASLAQDGQSLFIDSYHVVRPPMGEAVFQNEADAAKQIELLLGHGGGGVQNIAPPSRKKILLEVLVDLGRADDLLATIALEEARILGGKDAKSRDLISKAAAALADGRTQLKEGHYRQAIDHFKKSWLASVTATPPTPPHPEGAPIVNILNPLSGCIVTSSPISVSGMVQDIVIGTINGAEVSVTVNGVSATVANRSYLAQGVQLQSGLNVLVAIAKDKDGNIGRAYSIVFLDTSPQKRIQMVSGSNQSGPVFSALPEPLRVRLVDEAGVGVPGRRVVFRVTHSNGSLTGGLRATAVVTDAAGYAQAALTLGSRAGAGVDQVKGTATGFIGESLFTENATALGAAKIYVADGDRQRGGVGLVLPRPLIALVLDRGDNPIAGADVTFTVKKGGGLIDGAVAKTVQTDPHGRARITLTLGADEGLENNMVEATFPGITVLPAVFQATALVLGNPANTRVSGVVLDNEDRPIERVTMKLRGIEPTAVTDERGQFTITGVTPGHYILIADTSTTTRTGTWPNMEFDVDALPGRDNTVGMPIYILPLDIANGQQANLNTPAVVRVPSVPGFELTVPPGHATFPDGSKTGLVTVTSVHTDKVPMPPPNGTQPRFIVTINPAGTHFNPPAPVTFPNVTGLVPGTITELFSFDHDLASFVAIGTGTVSEDGRVIRSDPGFGIVKGGWHAALPSLPYGSVAPCEVTIVEPAERPIILTAGQTPKDTKKVVAQGTPAGGTYQWISNPTGIFSISPTNTSTVTITAEAPGTAQLKVTYTCPDGSTDDDSAPVIVSPCKVNFTNDSRGGDRVVSAKDDGLRMPGGKKILKVSVAIPSDGTATLKIVRTAGNSGRAFFLDGETKKDTIQVSGSDKSITILGDQLSDVARNMDIVATINDEPCGNFAFTVFKVELAAITSGRSADNIPIRALNNSGLGPDTLRAFYDHRNNSLNNGMMGYDRQGNVIMGGVYVQGRVLPKGMRSEDFAKPENGGFNIGRTISIRMYVDNCIPEFPRAFFPRLADPTAFASNEMNDDTGNPDEDNTANEDLGDGFLYLHSVDAPSVNITSLVKNSQSLRWRFNGTELATYDSVLCANRALWHVTAAGQRDAAGVYTEIPIATPQVENLVGLNHVALSPDLQEPTGMAPTEVKVVIPGNATVPAEDKDSVIIEISGKNLFSERCPTRALFLRQAVGPDGTVTDDIIPLNDITPSGNDILGTINTFGHLGRGVYRLQVFVGPLVGENPNGLTVVAP